jgi:hypothetical protein
MKNEVLYQFVTEISNLVLWQKKIISARCNFIIGSFLSRLPNKCTFCTEWESLHGSPPFVRTIFVILSKQRRNWGDVTSYCRYQSHAYTFKTSNTSSILKPGAGAYLIPVPGKRARE